MPRTKQPEAEQISSPTSPAAVNGPPSEVLTLAEAVAYLRLSEPAVLRLVDDQCLYTPLVEKATPLAEELLGMRSIFLSWLVYQTYNGYVMSQFKKMQADIRNQGQVKWKHVMHLIRLLLSGIGVLRDAVVPVRVEAHREQLLAVRRGEVPWPDVEHWRLSLHQEFNAAVESTGAKRGQDPFACSALRVLRTNGS